MTQEQFAQRTQRAADEPFVVARTGDGFRVYSPAAPSRVYEVGGSPEAPTCTCPDFRYHANDPNWRCKHILAVLRLADQVNGSARVPDPQEAEERAAIHEEGRGRRRKPQAAPRNGAAQMTLKRSVSPDGRIDALSVEFTCPVDSAPAEAITARALDTLALQAAIVDGFIGSRKPNEPVRTAAPEKQPEPEPPNGATPARLLSIGGMDGKWGRRLFISVQVNGRTAKLFGTSKQLGGALAAAGFPNREVAEGVMLDLPCRVVAKPTADGRYLNIEQVMPANASGRRS